MGLTPSGIYWDIRGEFGAPAVLLIEGYSGQAIGWRDEFCRQLQHAGYRVVRMDNRDIGMSRREPGAGYTIADMAGDVVDVLFDAGIPSATIVGQSMGGMIAQHVALDYPHVVDALVLFYTTPTRDFVAEDALQSAFVPPRSRDEAIEAFLTGDRATESPAYGYDETAKRTLAAEMWERDTDQSGIPRQRSAIDRFGDLRPRLKDITVPVALIHGRSDRLIPERGSMAIAEAVPQAELHLFPGMGHEVAPALWPEFVSVISRTERRSHASIR